MNITITKQFRYFFHIMFFFTSCPIGIMIIATIKVIMNITQSMWSSSTLSYEVMLFVESKYIHSM